MPGVLICDDSATMRLALRRTLEAGGMQVLAEASSGEDAVQLAKQMKPDLITMDVMLPGMDGFTVCTRVREAKNFTPILFLTAKNTEDDRVHGFETGGDDYLGKPFQVTELLLRVRAIMRRESWYRNRSLGGRQPFGDSWVDFENYCGEGPNGSFLMGVKECMILKLLIENAGKVVSRTDILDKVWGDETYPTTRTVDNFIVRIRRAMEKDPHTPRWVHTVRSVGYLFDPEGRQRRGED